MKGQKENQGATGPSRIQRPSGLQGHKGGFGYRGTLMFYR